MHNRLTSVGLLASVLLMIACMPVSAETVLYAQEFASVSGGFSYVGYAETADQFVLATDSTVTSVAWYGSPSAAGYEYILRFFHDNSGRPADTFFHQTAVVPSSVFYINDSGTDVYRNRASLDGNVALDAGTTYWLSIMGAPDREWIWSVAAQSGDDAAYFRFLNPGSPFYNSWTEMTNQVGRANEAFVLYNDSVPEPATLLPVGAALALLLRKLSGGKARARSN